MSALRGASISASTPQALRDSTGGALLPSSLQLKTACSDIEPPPQWDYNTCAKQLAAGHCTKRKEQGDGFCRRTCGLCQQPSKHWAEHLQLIHIPKTGGGTLSHFAQERGVLWSQFRPANEWPGGNCPFGCNSTFQPCSPWHIPPAVFISNALANPYADHQRFSVARHPYTRAISEYLWRGGECNAEGLNAAVQNVLERINASISQLTGEFHKAAFNHHRPHLSAEALVVASKTTFPGSKQAQAEREARREPSSDCHWLPQWMYVRSDRSHSIDVLHTETLTRDFVKFVRERGGTIQARDLRRSNAHVDHGCRLPVGALSQKSLQLLDSVYARDFKEFGYHAGIVRAREGFWRQFGVLGQAGADPLSVRAEDMVSADDGWSGDSGAGEAS